MTVRVSVVVPTYQRPDLLGRCLAALRAQDFPAEDYEILVADDGASAGTRQFVEDCVAAYGPKPRLRYVAVTGNHGPAAARNAGWRAAAGKIIAFTDDDCLPEPGWLTAGVAAFSDNTAAVRGRVRMPLPEVPTDYERDAAGLATAEFVTANCFCRKSALEQVGGFDERFTAAWREDSDLHFALLERGLVIADAPEAVAVHPVRPAPWGVSLRQQRKSMFNALLYKKYPALYRTRIQRSPPWHYYVAVATLGVAVGGAFIDSPWLVAGGLAVWLVLTARFCRRRLRGTSHAPGHVAEMVITSALIPPLAVYWRLRGAVKFRVAFL